MVLSVTVSTSKQGNHSHWTKHSPSFLRLDKPCTMPIKLNHKLSFIVTSNPKIFSSMRGMKHSWPTLVLPWYLKKPNGLISLVPLHTWPQNSFREKLVRRATNTRWAVLPMNLALKDNKGYRQQDHPKRRPA